MMNNRKMTMNTPSHPKTILRTITALILAALVFSLGASAQAGPESAVSIPSIDAFEQVTARAGWILFDGNLYWTKNDGASWTDITPVANIRAVDFLDASHGWTVVSATNGYSLASTTDGGRTWQTRALKLPALQKTDAPIAKIFMNWRTDLHGWLVFKLATGNNFSRGMLFVTFDGGKKWEKREIPLGEPASFEDENIGWVTGGPTGDQTFRTRDGGGSWESVSESGGQIKVQEEAGWTLWQSGECGQGVCVQEVQLQTRGGIPMRLPNGQNSLRKSFPRPMKSSLLADTDTTVHIGQGFDTCEIPELSEMQAWWDSSPYTAVNLYIGGSVRACGNAALNATYLTQLHAQGWRFIPTWVGPQAPCWSTNPNYVFSSSESAAYQDGRNEAEAAIAVAKSLGLTNPDGSGTIIYYDLEKYSEIDTDCRNAATAFINGWTYQLRYRGNLAGVYASPLNARDWWGITNQPDAVWLAQWDLNYYYNPNVSVYGSPYISDTYWNNHRRLRQYAGGHNETWGNVTINIDSDVLDGPLTVPNGTGSASAPAAPTGLTADTASATRVNLTWDAAAETPDNILVFANGAQVANLAGNATSYQVQNLACNTSHSFFLKAVRLGIKSDASAKVNAATPSCAPVLLSPLGGVANSLQPTFQWQAVEGASVYKIQVSARADFATFAIDAEVSATKYTPAAPLVVNKIYYWRVITIGAFGASDWSTASFTTPNPPPAPILASPASKALVTDYTPRLNWGDVTAPTGTTLYGYQVQVARTSDFAIPIYDATVTKSEFTPPANLPSNKIYYWRVRAFNTLGHYGAWSVTRSLRTAIRPPILVSPANGVKLLHRRPVFDWKDAVGANGYTLQVSRYSNFAALMVNASATTSKFTLPADLPANTTFYWRVLAKGVNGPSLWSKVWYFRTGNPPSIPAPTSPLKASTIDDLTPRLTWRASTLPAGTTFSRYQVQVSANAAFTAVILNGKVTALSPAEFTLTSPLLPNTKYYWRVRAVNTKGEYSAWSAVWNFKTSATAVFEWLDSLWRL